MPCSLKAFIDAIDANIAHPSAPPRPYNLSSLITGVQGDRPGPNPPFQVACQVPVY